MGKERKRRRNLGIQEIPGHKEEAGGARWKRSNTM